MNRPSTNLTQWRSRLKNGLLAFAFVAAYAASATAPFVTGTVYADDTQPTEVTLPTSPPADAALTTCQPVAGEPLGLQEVTSPDSAQACPAAPAPVPEPADETTPPPAVATDTAQQPADDSAEPAQLSLRQPQLETVSAPMTMLRDTPPSCPAGEQENRNGLPLCPSPKIAHVYTHQTPVCGPNNDQVWDTGDHYSVWRDTGWKNGKRTVVFKPDRGYLFASAGDYSHIYTDHNTPCEEPEEPELIANPVVQLKEICGPHNDTLKIKKGRYTLTSDTWAGNVRTLVFTAKPGYVFASGPTYTMQFTDHNTPCEEPEDTTIPAPTVEQDEVCGPNNDELSIQSGHFTVHSDTGWVNNARTIVFKATRGYTFADGKKTMTVVYTDENVPCGGGTETTTIPAPQASRTVVCGPNNDTIVLDDDETVTVQSESPWNNGKKTIVYAAKPGYIFANGPTYTVTYTDDNTPCGSVLGVTTPVPPATPMVLGAATRVAVASGYGGAQLENTGTSLTTVVLLSVATLTAAALTMTNFFSLRQPAKATQVRLRAVYQALRIRAALLLLAYGLSTERIGRAFVPQSLLLPQTVRWA